jgi:hypothetical protein
VPAYDGGAGSCSGEELAAGIDDDDDDDEDLDKEEQEELG